MGEDAALEFFVLFVGEFAFGATEKRGDGFRRRERNRARLALRLVRLAKFELAGLDGFADGAAGLFVERVVAAAVGDEELVAGGAFFEARVDVANVDQRGFVELAGFGIFARVARAEEGFAVDRKSVV